MTALGDNLVASWATGAPFNPLGMVSGLQGIIGSTSAGSFLDTILNGVSPQATVPTSAPAASTSNEAAAAPKQNEFLNAQGLGPGQGSGPSAALFGNK